MDPDDTEVYTSASRFYLMVQRGVVLPYVISEDMTLTNDNYWLVPRAVLIEEGATLTVTEGTQIQFGSDYSGLDDDAYIQVEGSLVIAGSVADPVHIFQDLVRISQSIS